MMHRNQPTRAILRASREVHGVDLPCPICHGPLHSGTVGMRRIGKHRKEPVVAWKCHRCYDAPAADAA